MKKERKDKHFIKKPVYPGGLKLMRSFITENLRYPKKAIEHKKEGTVRLKYDIDYKGNVTEVYVLSSVGYGCDEEAIRLVKLLKFHVEKTRKMRVVFHKTIQINFRLPKVKIAKPVAVKPTNISKVSYSYVTTSSKTNKSASPNTPQKKQVTYTYQINVTKN